MRARAFLLEQARRYEERTGQDFFRAHPELVSQINQLDDLTGSNRTLARETLRGDEVDDASRTPSRQAMIAKVVPENGRTDPDARRASIAAGQNPPGPLPRGAGATTGDAPGFSPGARVKFQDEQRRLVPEKKPPVGTILVGPATAAAAAHATPAASPARTRPRVRLPVGASPGL